MTPKPAGFLFRWFSIVVVSAWLLLAACWLMLTRRIDRPPLLRVLRAKFRPRYRGVIKDFRREQGSCWQADLPRHLMSDQEASSRLILLENGVAMPRPHCGHDEIRRQGEGRYSHWGPTLYFSTSDNSDPTTNGRTYSVEER